MMIQTTPLDNLNKLQELLHLLNSYSMQQIDPETTVIICKDRPGCSYLVKEIEVGE